MGWFKRQRKEGELIKQPGAHLDVVDERDYIASVDTDALPRSHSLRVFCPPVKSQGMANSCTAHAVVTCYEIEAKVLEKKWFIEGSEQYNYHFSRIGGGQWPNDKGAYLREACKVLQSRGNCPEQLMPYNAHDINNEPGAFTDSFARFFKVAFYSRIIDVDVIRANVYGGHPVALTIPLYPGFYNVPPADPNVPLPRTGDRLHGYHAIAIVGYDDDKAAFEIFNSWGPAWGDHGFAWIPYEYLKKHDFDAWVLRL